MMHESRRDLIMIVIDNNNKIHELKKLLTYDNMYICMYHRLVPATSGICELLRKKTKNEVL